MMPDEIVLEGFIPSEKTGSYLHLPFDVPPGTNRIDVQYTYDSAISAEPHYSGGNTIDIGLFDERGIDGKGFRGWSGSDRAGFFVGTDDATPGYLAGPILPGTWHVFLGLYKLAPQGCHYTITVRTTPGNSQAATFAPMLSMDRVTPHPPFRPDGWYRGELHCHSIHSDGDTDPRDIIAWARRLGLDFLAITDHNIQSHLCALAPLYPEGLILIPGCEVTTYRGHWNIWGSTGWIDFRIETPDQMQQQIAQAAAQGYLTSCNHPCQFGVEWWFEGVRGNDCVEVWNGPWPLMNTEGLAFWEARLREGERLTAVGGSDMHHADGRNGIRLGTPTTWVYCPGSVTAAGLLAGLRAGHVFLSDAPDGPQLYLGSGSAMMGDVIERPASGTLAVSVRVVHGQGLALELCGAMGRLQRLTPKTDDQLFELSLPVSDQLYVRAQLVEPDSQGLMMRALTNPLYIR